MPGAGGDPHLAQTTTANKKCEKKTILENGLTKIVIQPPSK